MRFGALFACILFGLAAGSPTHLRQRDANGDAYEYGVHHPAGHSRVSVRTGNNRNGNRYPAEINYLQHGEYIPKQSYGSSYTDNSPYQPHRHGPHPHYDSHENQGRGHTPVYMESSYPQKPVHLQEPSYPHSPYEQDGGIRYLNGQVISQDNSDRTPFYNTPDYGHPSHGIQSDYSEPHIQQITDDSSPNYDPNKIEQQSLKEIPFYDSSSAILPSGKLNPDPSQLPIIQQESDDLIKIEPSDYKHHNDPSLSQQPLDFHIVQDPPTDEEIRIDQIPLDFPTKINVPAEESQIILQEPLENKPLYDTQPESIQSVKTLIHPEPPAIQQEFIDLPLTEPVPNRVVKYDADDIVAQGVLDDKSSVNPITDIISPTESEIVFEEPTLGQVPIDDFQTSIDTHPSQAIYDSSIEPNFSDSDDQSPKHLFTDQPKFHFIPVGKPYEKYSHSTEIVHPALPHSQQHLLVEAPFTKNIPQSHSVKLPPPAQEPLTIDIQHTKIPPPSHSVKLPPPAQELLLDAPHTKNPPLSHSVKLALPVQETLLIDIPHTKNPSPIHSVKLPPPVQEPLHIDVPLTINPPTTHSVKLLPPAQEQLLIDIPHTKIPPSSHSVKLPPPAQELLLDAPHTKNLPLSHSVKLPPPVHEPLHIDITHAKNPPPSYSVKLPPPTQEQLHIDVPHTKVPLPSHSVKLPSPPQELLLDAPHTKNPPLPHSVKLPPPVQEPLHIDIPHTKNYPPIHSVKLPPLVQEPLHIDVPHTKIPLPSHSVKLPPPAQELILLDAPHTKNPPLSHSVKLPPSEQKYLNVEVPYTKNPSSSYFVKYPPLIQEPLHAKIPYTKNFSPSYSIKHSPPQQVPYHVRTPHTKSPILSHSVKIPPSHQEPIYVDIPNTKNVHLTPLNKLPPIPQEHLSEHALPPISHSIKNPYSSIKSVSPHIKAPPAATHLNGFYPVGVQTPHASNSIKHPSVPASPHSNVLQENIHLNHPLNVKEPAGYHPDSHGVELLESAHPGALNHPISPEDSEFKESSADKSVFEKYGPISHSVRLSLPPAEPKILSLPEVQTDKIDKPSPLEKYSQVSHAIRLPNTDLKPKVTAVPNLFVAIPSSPADDDSNSLLKLSDSPDAKAQISGTLNEALLKPDFHSPVSHSVRLNIPSLRSSNNHDASSKEIARDISEVGVPGDVKKEDFPAFPVESALKQKDPVSDAVAHLPQPQGYRATAGYLDTNDEPDDESGDSPSVNDARLEVERINREIGVSFGTRLSPYSRL